MGLYALNWYGVAQDRLRWYELCQSISSGGVPRESSVVTGSFIFGCGRRTFDCSGDLTTHKRY